MCCFSPLLTILNAGSKLTSCTGADPQFIFLPLPPPLPPACPHLVRFPNQLESAKKWIGEPDCPHLTGMPPPVYQAHPLFASFQHACTQPHSQPKVWYDRLRSLDTLELKKGALATLPFPSKTKVYQIPDKSDKLFGCDFGCGLNTCKDYFQSIVLENMNLLRTAAFSLS